MASATDPPENAALGEPEAYLLHEGMGNYLAVWAHGFDVEAHGRLDPVPLFRCPSWPHDKGLVYDAEADERRVPPLWLPHRYRDGADVTADQPSTAALEPCPMGRTDYEACFAPFRFCAVKGCGRAEEPCRQQLQLFQGELGVVECALPPGHGGKHETKVKWL